MDDQACVPANRMRKDCHAAHHERGNVEEVDGVGGSSSSSNPTGNSSQSSSSQPTRDGTPQLQASSQEVHQRAGTCTIYLVFSVVFSWGAMPHRHVVLECAYIQWKTNSRKRELCLFWWPSMWKRWLPDIVPGIYWEGGNKTNVIHQRCCCQTPLRVAFGLGGSTSNARMRNAGVREPSSAVERAHTAVNLGFLLAGK